MEIIRRIRSKQDESKARYAFLGACVVTVLVGMIWASTLPARFSGVISEDDLGASLLESTSLDAMFPQNVESGESAPLFPGAEPEPVGSKEGTSGGSGIDVGTTPVPLLDTSASTTLSAPMPRQPVLVMPHVESTSTIQSGGTTTRTASSSGEVIMIATTTSQRSE